MGGLSVIESQEREDWKHSLVEYFLGIFQTRSEEARTALVDLFGAIELGHSCAPVDSGAAQKLQPLLRLECKNPPLVLDQELLFLSRHYRQEQQLAHEIKRLLQAQPLSCDLEKYLDLLDDPHQQTALLKAAQHNISVITGGAGTGKTHTLARIIAGLHAEAPELQIALAAPTGKAAQRMHEALHKALADRSLTDRGLVTDTLKTLAPVTIHRLLGMGMRGNAQFNSDLQLSADLVVVDEVSMLDLGLALKLFSAIKSGARVILLGDADQLSSVDVGHVLADLQESNLLAQSFTRLIKSRRFRADASIYKAATAIQSASLDSHHWIHDFEQAIERTEQLGKVDLQQIKGDLVRYCSIKANTPAITYLDQLFEGYADYIQRLKDYVYGQRDADELQRVVAAFDSFRVLTATKHGEYGLHAINRHFKARLAEKMGLRNGVRDWYIGRPVLITQNDYRLGLSNGDIGICLYHRSNQGEFEVYFPTLGKWISANQLPGNIQTAFGLTIHKSQGSEFSHVAIVVDQAAERLLSQELLYTAITRAKEIVSLLVDESCFRTAVHTRTIRKSGLTMHLDR